MSELLQLISPDDHVVAPPHLWQDRLPAKYKEDGPRVVRERGRARFADGWTVYEQDDDGVESDVWVYDGEKSPLLKAEVAKGMEGTVDSNPTTYDRIRLGTFEQKARLDDMDMAGIEASVCYPNMFVRFAGQRFSFAKDKDLALACLQAYNDWIAEEWYDGSDGRLIPMGLVPLWDTELAIAELRRNANRGFPTVAFVDMPHLNGLPSIHSGHWDGFFAACNETETVLSIHVGTGGLPTMSKDAPAAFMNSMMQINTASGLTDWLFSGLLERNPELKLSFAEPQAGWVPYQLYRCDSVWEDQRGFTGVEDSLPRPPSEYFREHVYMSFFKDEIALSMVDKIGEDNLLYETDYPHSDSSWPNAAEYGREITSHLDPPVARKILRDNAARIFRYEAKPNS